MKWLSRLLAWISACIRNALGWLTSGFPTREDDAPRIPDEYYSRLIKMYRARATFWRSVGLSCLFATALIIVFGFWIFYHGDPAGEQRAESEIDLAVELAGERRKVTEIGTSGARTLAQAAIAGRAYVLADVLGRLKPTLDSFLSKPEDAQFQNLQLIADANVRILRALKSTEVQQQKLVDLGKVEVINVSAVVPNDSSRFPLSSLELLRSEIRLTGESMDTISTDLDRVMSLLRSMPGDSEKEQLKQLAEAASLAALDKVDGQVELREQQTSQALELWHQDAPIREEQRQAIESNIADIEGQLGEVRAERDKLLFMSWVPDLTLRVGSVVLLLFLTQILLSAYRYTIALSTFYLSRADAIQLLQPRANEATWYSIEHFEKLMDKLSPTAISIDAVKSPSDHLVDLASAWIGTKGK